MVTFANVGSVCLPSLKFVGFFAFGRYGAFSVSDVYLQQFPSYSNHNCKKIVMVVTRVHCGQTVHPRPIVTMEH